MANQKWQRTVFEDLGNALATMDASRPFTEPDSEHARYWRELTLRLLALRHERIVPLLKSGRTGPAAVIRRGEYALSAAWAFQDGTITAHVNLGSPPDDPAPAMAPEPNDLVLGDIASDPYAFAFTVSRT